MSLSDVLARACRVSDTRGTGAGATGGAVGALRGLPGAAVAAARLRTGLLGAAAAAAPSRAGLLGAARVGSAAAWAAGGARLRRG